MRGRLISPSGEIRDGGIDINLESEDEKDRISVVPKETNLYVVNPGIYYLLPTRGVFGGQETEITVDFNGQSYRAPFPQSILHHDKIVVKPGKIVSIGVLEARLKLVPGNPQPELTVTLYDDVQTRRDLVEQMIHNMMDPKISPELRDNAANWTMALDQALIDLQEAHDAASPANPASP